MPKLIIFLNLVLFLSSYTNILFANENQFSCVWDNKNDIPCIQISGNASNSSKYSKSFVNKIVISKKEILESGAVDLIDVLKTIPDVNITQSGPMGQQASMFMRGTGSNHTLVLINGIPINDQSTTQGLHDFGVDFVQTIHQIEIYPGSSASHFGTNAIGGAVNIIMTGDYKESFSLTTDVNANYELSGNKTLIYDKSSLNIKIGSVKNETISARGNSSDEKDGVKNYSTNINYEKFLNENIRLYNTTYLRQTKAKYDNSNTNQIGYEGNNKMASMQFGLDNKNNIQKQSYIFYYNIYNREYDERGVIDTYESEVLGLKYDLTKTLGKKISYGIGSEYKYDWGYFDNNGAYDASTKGYTKNLALHGNLGWNIFPNTNLSFFGRTDNHKQTGLNNSFKLNFDQKFNNFNLGMSYMEGLRNPTLYEMFGTDNYGYSGNRNLKPEKSSTYELYSNVNLNKNLTFTSRVFKANIHNNIEYLNNKYQNDSDDIDLNQSGLINQLDIKLKNNHVKLFSSFLSSKKENGSDQLRRPEKNYGLSLSRLFNNNLLGELNLNFQYNHYGKHYDTHSSNFSTIQMDSTDIVDVVINKNIKNNEFYLKISNLLDESFEKPHGYNQEKRMIKFGIRY